MGSEVLLRLILWRAIGAENLKIKEERKEIVNETETNWDWTDWRWLKIFVRAIKISLSEQEIQS